MVRTHRGGRGRGVDLRCGGLTNGWLGYRALAPAYAAAVSLYSVALVFYAVNSRSARVAATIYAVAGWTGSALGIGFVEVRPTVPSWIVAMVAVIIAFGFLARGVLRGRAKTGEGNKG